jgi:hypothetical protein
LQFGISLIGRVVAYLKGDGFVGYLARSRTDEIIEFSSRDRDMFDFFVKFITLKFGKCGYFRERIRKDTSFIFRIKRADVYSFFQKYAPYGTHTWRITPKMFGEDPEFKKDFIVGLIEAEGYVDIFTGRIVVYSSNLQGLKDFKKLLTEFKISSRIVGPYAGAYRLLIYGERNLTKILGFGFCCKRKENQLKLLLKRHFQKSSAELIQYCSWRAIEGAVTLEGRS